MMTSRSKTWCDRGSRLATGARCALLGACAAVTFAISSCDEDPTAPGATPPARNIRFDSLEVGQRSVYVFFWCDHYGYPSVGTSTYDQDTLLVEVRREDPEGFLIRESLTPGSVSHSGPPNVPDPDAIYEYHVQVHDDTLFVIKPQGTGWYEGSRIFLARTDRFALAPVAAPQTYFVDWQPDLPYHEDLMTAFVPTHVQLDRPFDDLNILQDNRAMQTDGPGFLFAYAGNHGLVRWAYYSWWTQAGSGWDLLSTP
jgi:hypothetical protein